MKQLITRLFGKKVLYEQSSMMSLAEPKVFGAGLAKTGTTTLGKCFQILGYQHADFDLGALQAMMQGDIKSVLDRSKQFNAFEDCPWFLLYQTFAESYQDAKFILTIRESENRWLQSALQHDARENSDPVSARVKEFFIAHYCNLGVDFTDPTMVYQFHNQRVKEYFASCPERLLIVCWEAGDGWEKLCTFLGKPIPVGIPFPHENAAPWVRREMS